MKCSNCGCKNTKENPVTKETDPYQSDIYDDDTEVWECAECRYELGGDIDEV